MLRSGSVANRPLGLHEPDCQIVQEGHERLHDRNKPIVSIAPPNTRGIRSAVGERFVAGPVAVYPTRRRGRDRQAKRKVIAESDCRPVSADGRSNHTLCSRAATKRRLGRSSTGDQVMLRAPTELALPRRAFIFHSDAVVIACADRPEFPLPRSTEQRRRWTSPTSHQYTPRGHRSWRSSAARSLSHETGRARVHCH